MTLRETITGIYIYKYHLFKACLDGTIEVIELPTFRKKFNLTRIKDPFVRQIESNKNLIIGMQALQNVLFAATTQELFSYNLSGDQTLFQLSYGFYKGIGECRKIIINNKTRVLYVISDLRGIVAIDIRDVKKPKFLNDLESNELNEVSRGGITGIDVFDNSIVLAIRNRGVMRIFIGKQKSRQIVERELLKIALEDVQDLKAYSKTNSIYIVDSERGFLIFNTSNNRIEFEQKLPNHDLPKSIVLYKSHALIRGSQGVYLYNSKKKNIEKILEKKIGSIDTYYNHVFYTQAGELKVMILSTKDDVPSSKLFNSNSFKDVKIIKL